MILPAHQHRHLRNPADDGFFGTASVVSARLRGLILAGNALL